MITPVPDFKKAKKPISIRTVLEKKTWSPFNKIFLVIFLLGLLMLLVLVFPSYKLTVTSLFDI